jgi:quinolinate synthase
MPVLEIVGPPTERQPLPPHSFAGRNALERFGTRPAPPLEWNAKVERETAHLYERIKNVVPSVNGRSSRPTWPRSTR